MALITDEALSSSQKRALLKEILGKRVAEAKSLPLSYGQAALWFLQQLDPSSAAYNVPFALRIVSAIDRPALRRACEQLSARHSALRLRFRGTHAGPVQEVARGSEVALSEVDVTGLPLARVMERVTAEAQRPFDLERGPVCRVQLFSLSEVDHVLLLNGHHIAIDFWSLLIVTEELGATYRQLANGASVASLPPLSRRYEDYISAQRELMAGPDGERLWCYWRDRLAGALPALALPLDSPPPATQSFRGKSHGFRLPAELSSKLRELAGSEQTTLNTVLLAVFKILLARLSGQREILVGSPTAGRQSADLADVVGYFVNPVVLRSTCDEALPFRAFLREVRETLIGALRHQEYPFPLLVEKLQPVRYAGRSPLFQAMFVLQQPHRALALSELMTGEAGVRGEFGGMEVESLSIESPGAQFDLELMMLDTGAALSGHFLYNTDVLTADTVRRWSESFTTLLAAVVEGPDTRITELAMLSEAARHQLLVEWNRTALPGAADGCFHRAFERQARALPSAIAACDDRESLSYAELDERANQLARYLQSRGVGPETLVGICMDRSLGLLIAILAVFKAGGSYVPLDPEYPKERVAFVVEDAGAAVVLTTCALRTQLPRSAAEILCVDNFDTQRRLSALPADALSTEVNERNLCYVIYTSGSTGRPKGAMIEQRGMMNHLRAKIRDLTLSETDRVLQNASACFDISVWQFLAALLVGAQVVIASEDVARDPERLLTFIDRAGISIAEVVPAVLKGMLGAADPRLPAGSGLRCLRTLLVTGEALPADLCGTWLAHYPGIPLLNAYGPTECSDDVTHHFVRTPPAASSGVPIGRALVNIRLYVLDRHFEPVPVGVFGELYVGGAGVGRGYHHRPGKTAESFLPDPFGRPGERLYRTGDLARYLSDGSLEFGGRFDHQVKIRGFRIELGEIEAVLRAHPALRDAVVIADRGTLDAKREDRLVGYVTPEHDRVPGEALRAHLQERLPSYMVPSHLIWLDALPLTPNGKLDRSALPTPDDCPAAATAALSPRTPTEEILLAICATILGRERIGVHDELFALGAHSLQVTQIASRVRDAFRIEIPLRAVFEAPTLSMLAARIDAIRNDGKSPALPPLQAVPRDRPLPLSFAQQRLWFLDQWEPNSPLYNIPIALRTSGALDLPALEQALNTVIARHEVLRTAFALRDGEPVQVVVPSLELSLAPIDWQGLSPDEQSGQMDAVIDEEAYGPFDLEHGPLLRAKIVCLAADEHLLLLTIHHIACDGWTLGVLVQELGAAYDALSKGEAPPLPPLPIQYGDYACWQRDWLQGAVLEEQLAYWKEQLYGLEVLDLPTDRRRPPLRTTFGAALRVAIPEELVRALRTLSQREGATLFMTLLAAFQTLLYRYTGQEDIAVGTPIANRNHSETEGLIGFFVNTLVLRTTLSGHPSFRQLVRRVREAALEAYAHQDLPLERLVDALQTGRDLAHTPLFQVVFALNNARPPDVSLGQVATRVVEPPRRLAKFDLTLLVDETGDSLDATWEFRTDLWDEASIRRMAAHYLMILEAVVADVEIPVSAVSLLTPEQRAALLAMAQGQGNVGSSSLVHERFAEHAARQPQVQAVACGEESLSYSALDVQASRVARGLRAAGVGHGVVVGVCMERSPELVVALLAVLKAGGAYLPLDPAYPRDRLAYMVEDAGVHVIVGRADTVEESIGAPTGVVVIDPNHMSDESELVAPLAAQSKSLPGDPAYVIYTSGSTGRPKGVVVSHENVARLFASTEGWFQFDASDVWTLFHAYSFDFSVWEIWGALAYGGRLVVVPYAVSRSPDEFHALLVREGVTVLSQTPSAFRQLIAADASEEAAALSLRYVIFGGEALDPNTLRSWIERHGDQSPRLINMYGITETTVHVTYRQIVEADCFEGAPSVIGQPLPDLSLYLLDARMEPVPIGVAGEIYVGGAGVTRGYLGRPALTAQRFVPDPFSTRPGNRLYRSGDRARLRADGEVEYLGRIDHQVKIRGFRIELGEVESIVAEHPAVREAAVVARPAASGELSLFAYAVARAGETLSPPALRDFLRTRLPEHMMPIAIAVLDNLPLTRNGKVDKAALRSNSGAELASAAGYLAPNDELEHQLASIWAEVLSVGRVSVDGNFFELGGNSLLSVRVQAKIQERFAIKLRIVDLFQYPTVRALARFLAGGALTDPATQREALDARAQGRRSALQRQGQRRLRARKDGEGS